MAQLSRPYQIGLAAIALLAAVWVLALRGNSSSSSSTPAAPQVATTTPAHTPSSSAPAKHAGSKSPGGSSQVYHGAAPGVEGLTRAVAKAHEAAATAQQNATQLQKKSEQASSASPSSSSSSSAAPSTSATKPSTSGSATKSTEPTTTTKSSAGTAGHVKVSSRQRSAEAALKKGDVVVLLFWDSHGSDDMAVHKAVQSVNGEHKVFTSQAPSNLVAAYGSITRGVQVYGTPTLLIVNPKGKTITLTGLQDAYAIRQAIAEIRH